MTTTTDRKSWAEFNRFKPNADFFGCIDAEGAWFDSADLFGTAIHFCCADAGVMGLNIEEEIEWMDEIGKAKGYSIVHSTLLRRMYEAGLVK
jgi:hypothetical protein